MSNETTTSNNKASGKKPDFVAFSIRERGENKAKWTEIGVAFRNKDGGFTVLFDAVPLSGKIVLRAAESKE